MKITLKISAAVLALILCFGLVACGSDDKATTNENETKTETGTVEPTGTPITAPDLNLDSSVEEEAIFTMEAGGESDEVKVYYKDDIIQSITLTSIAPADGRTKDELNELKDQIDTALAEIAEKDFVSYSCVVTDDEISVVMACNDLEEKDNFKYVADLGMFEGLTENTTYSQFAEILANEGYEKQ
ncbi:MAG: hypothetical protein IJZ94_00290 [Clostridia bacterium]|nr:hypothetical protein [Clostridia bacterium]